MTVIQRLTKFAKPYLGNLYTGVCLTAISTFLETAVVSALIASMVALVTGDQSPAASAKTNIPSLPVAPGLSERLVALKSQLLAYLSHFCGGSDPSKIQQLIILALLTVFVVLLKCGFFSRASYLMHRFAQLMSRDLRGRLFAHLVRQPPAYYETERTGAQLTRITSDVVMLQQNLGPELIQVLQAPLTIIISLSIMAWLSWQLMLSVLCLAPLIALVMGIAGKKIRKIAVSMQERLGDLNAGLLERLANIRVVQSFVRERYEIDHVARFNDRYYRETMKSVLVSETLAPSVEFIAWVGMVLGVILGGTQVLSHRMDANSFLYFMFVAQRAGSQFKALSRINQIRQIINGAGERILGTLDVVPEIQDRPNAVTLPHITGNVVFDHLHFGYRSGGDVLSDINLQVEPGEVIALVGPSGSGKTTLVNLLPRFYDPIQGRILIDGHDIRDVSLDSLREQVGIVPQETLLFSGSIYENILYGRLEATEAEVIEAARSANALEFIDRLPDGFQTVVGERGARLSGGQRQRVAIARALLKNPRILILDEATSALDTESEHLVQQALERLMLNRTTFVIAHRLSTVKGATRLLVLDHGRIVESGTHEELLALGGLYSRLYEMQFRTGEMDDALTEVSVD